MRRFLFAISLLLVSLNAFAESPHYKPARAVTCSPASASVTGSTFADSCTTGEVSGLGNQDLTFGVIASVNAGTFCHNKGNPALIVPGQNPAIAQFSNLQTIPGSDIKNGTTTLPVVTFSFSLSIPTPEVASCPSDNNWTVTLGPATWTAKYVVYQPFPTLLDSLSFNF